MPLFGGRTPRAAGQQPAPQRRRPEPLSPLMSCIGAIFIFLLIAAALAIMITVILLHPHRPRYRFRDVQISMLTVTTGSPPAPMDNLADPYDSLLNADITVIVEAYNKNQHLDIYNTRLLAILSFAGVELGRSDLGSFFQARGNRTFVQGPGIFVRGLPLRRSIAASVNAEWAKGGLALKGEVASRVKFRRAGWTSSWHRWFKVKCSLIVSSSSAPGGSHIAFESC